MMAFEGKPLSQIWDDLQKEIGYELTYLRADMRLNDFTQKGLMKILTEKPLETLAGEKVTRVGRKDGLKLYLDDSNWLLIRPSGTEPLIRLYYEGTSSERTNKVAEDFAKQVEAIVSDLEKEADKAQDSQKSQKKDPTAKKSPAGPIETVGAKA